MSQAVARSSIGSMTYIAPVGALCAGAPVTALHEAVTECIAAGQLQLILDLEQVTLIDGRAMEVVHDSDMALTRSGGWLKFVNPSPLVRDILIATGLADARVLGSAADGELMSFGEDYSHQEPRKLGEILLEMGVVTAEQIESAADL